MTPSHSFKLKRRMSMAAVSMLMALAAASTAPAAGAAGPESVNEAICRIVDDAARTSGLPPGFLTRLIWSESSFRPHVVSPAGAQGIAQFMPGTAAERGLADPFDPETAIPKSAELLADLVKQFGNVGLAAAAYNAGPRRVADWRANKGGLPLETRDYVLRVTGREADDWNADLAKAMPSPPTADAALPCLTVTASLRRSGLPEINTAFAPWGVQLAGGFSRGRALAVFEASRRRYAGVVGNVDPMIIGTRLRSRGRARFYRIRIPAPTRAAAESLCNRIHSVGGACITLRS